MVISVQNNLKNIKDELSKKGYEVYDFSDRVISDVYIYSEEDLGLINAYTRMEGNGSGSLIINAAGKTISEIMYSIKSRLYSPLF